MFLIVGENTYKHGKWKAGKNPEMLDWNWTYQYELMLVFFSLVLKNVYISLIIYFIYFNIYLYILIYFKYIERHT